MARSLLRGVCLSAVLWADSGSDHLLLDARREQATAVVVHRPRHGVGVGTHRFKLLVRFAGIGQENDPLI